MPVVSWKHPGRPVILASDSPRRKAIMARMGFTFKTASPARIDEAAYYLDSGGIMPSLKALARAKADSVAAAHPQALVLGADTVVVRGRKILGKPAGRENARAVLESLSGSRHRVYTGLALVCRVHGFSVTASSCTDVFFRKLCLDEIEEYLALGEHRDKAGSYAIQGRAMVFVDRVDGCYYNVVGLPVAATIGLFMKYVRTRGVTYGSG